MDERFTFIPIASIPERKQHPGENAKLLNDFLDSDADAVEVNISRWKDAHAAFSSLYASRNGLGLQQKLKVIKRRDRVFLVKGGALDVLV